LYDRHPPPIGCRRLHLVHGIITPSSPAPNNSTLWPRNGKPPRRRFARARHADIRLRNNVLAMDAPNSLFCEAIKRKSHRRAMDSWKWTFYLVNPIGRALCAIWNVPTSKLNRNP